MVRRWGLAALLMLSACATSYQSSGFMAGYFGGFEEVALAPNVYRVTFKGNGYTDTGRAEEMALLRSADLTLQKGFTHFALTDSNSYVATSSFVTPRQSDTQFQAQQYGPTIQGTANTTTYGGGTVFIRKPRATNIVVMMRNPPPVVPAYDAAFLCQSLGAKYKARCGEK